MPLDKHHAFGSFILDILDRKNIQIFSDGQSIRSYLYVSDLTIWLWKILLEGKSCYPYNVGSEQEITLRELAELISEYSIGAKVEILNNINSKNNTKYIPSIERIKTELGVTETTGLREGIVKTLSYFHTYKGKYQS
jgi:dTDP-glucose 4,6-dehydratase